MTDSRLRRAVDRTADLTVIGLLTVLASLPVVTALAALTAAAATTGSHGSGSTPSRFLASFRGSLRRTLGPQVILLAAGTVGAGDLVVGVTWAGEPARPALLSSAVIACGVLLVATVLVLPTYLATLPLLTGDRLTSLRTAVTLASARPLASLGVAVSTVVLLAGAAALPVLVPTLVGVHVAVGLTIVHRTSTRAGLAPSTGTAPSAEPAPSGPRATSPTRHRPLAALPRLD